MPKYWYQAVIAEMSEEFGMDSETIDELDGADRDAVKNLATAIFGIRMNQKFPRAAIRKVVMKRLLQHLAVKLGNRHEIIAKSDDSWDANYQLDPDAIGSYTKKPTQLVFYNKERKDTPEQ